jgi:hypothetical protein
MIKSLPEFTGNDFLQQLHPLPQLHFPQPHPPELQVQVSQTQISQEQFAFPVDDFNDFVFISLFYFELQCKITAGHRTGCYKTLGRIYKIIGD